MPSPQIKRNIDKAVSLFRGGMLQEAADAAQKVLAAEPEQPDALHLLGSIALQRREIALARALVARAIQAQTSRGLEKPRFYQTWGMIHAALLQWDEAAAAYQRVLQLKPDHADAMDGLGIVMATRGKLGDAIAWFRAAVAAKPKFIQARLRLARSLEQRGLVNDLKQAEAEFETAAATSPPSADAIHDWGLFQGKRGRLDRSIATFRRALTIDPNHQKSLVNLSVALVKSNRDAEAITLLERAIPLSHSARDRAHALREYGMRLGATGRPEEAIIALTEAVALAPDDPGTRASFGVALLTAGDFERGWSEYQWRWQAQFFPTTAGRYMQPLWDGSDLHGRTLLVHTEQGFGDQIQFCRYVPVLADRGIRVALESHPELLSLMHSLRGVAELKLTADSIEEYHVRIPLLDLPHVLKTTIDSIPANVPYLAAEPARVEVWQEFLRPYEKQLHVGMVWAGRPAHARDTQRSIPLSSFAPIFSSRPDAVFISLQKLESGRPSPKAPQGTTLIDCGHRLKDFADTAALISKLDLIIGVDTAVVHLAGALGKPVWVMLPHSPDFRWMLDRTDSPWYPSMRLFRQQRPGEWSQLLESVAATLSEFSR